MKFKVRAQWTGPDGRQMGVADEVECESAVEALDNAVPSEWRDGEFTGASVKIELIQ